MTLPHVTTEGAIPFRPVPQPEAPTQKILMASIPRFDQDNWCWAAVAVGVAQAYDRPAVPQCEVATSVTRLLTPSSTLKCCPKGSNAACDFPRPLSFALKNQNVHDHFNGDRTFDFVVSEIDHQRLVPVALVAGRAGHAVVIAGYVKGGSGSENQLVVWDPTTGEREPVGFTEFRDRFLGKWSWSVTYVTTGGRAEIEVP